MTGGLQSSCDFAHELIKRNASPIYKIAISYTGSKADAENILNEVFLRYLKYKGTFASPEQEKTWFIRVTINCCKEHLRGKAGRQTASLDYITPRSIVAPYDIQRDTKILDAIIKLKPKQRLYIHLFYYEELPISKISELTGMKEAIVKMLLKRAHTSLRALLQRSDFDV